MKDYEIINLCRRESADAEQYVFSEIVDDRDDALSAFMGDKYGDEQQGRSQVIDRTVLETIEWAMPSILKVFAGGDEVVQFTPEQPEDEEAAAQATDYANYVFYKDNNGFLIINSWVKDALLSKMGVVKTWWETKEKIKDSEHSGLSDEQYAVLIADDDIEVLEHTQYVLMAGEMIEFDEGDMDEAEDMGEPMFDPMTGMPFPKFHDCKIRRTIEEGRIKTVPVPPEEFFISRKGTDADDATYLEQRTDMTVTDLINMGFDEEDVKSIPSSNEEDTYGEKQTRMGLTQSDIHSDPTMRTVTVRESYLYMDKEDEGVARRYKVIWAGEEVLECEQQDDQPFSLLTAIPIPHRAYGLSLADITTDIQQIRTTLLRQTLDNYYLANAPQREVDVNKIVTMDDLLMSRPGGIIRVEEIGAIREVSIPFVAQHSFAMLDGLDSMAAKRTGISGAVTGVDADVLNNETATASNNQAAAANQRIETICRIFAETGFKHLFRIYLKLMVKHQDKPRSIRLRNEWVEMDPRHWNADMDVNVDVGLGHGNKDQQVTHLMGILNWQKELLASGGVGMVRPKHIYNTFEKMVKAVGFKSIDDFMDDPGDEGLPQQQQQDPNAALIQGQMQIEQLKAQQRQAENQMKAQVEIQKAQIAHQHEMHKLALEKEKLEIEREKIAADLDQTAAKLEVDKEKAGAQLAMEADKLRMEGETRNVDRHHTMMEKQNDREHAMKSMMMKPSKTVRMERGEDGSLTGTVDEG